MMTDDERDALAMKINQDLAKSRPDIFAGTAEGAIAICARYDGVLITDDSRLTFCADCATPIQYRPVTEPALMKVCVQCGADRIRGVT